MKINEKNLCVFATSPPFDKEGFLSKRGEVNKAFQRRYFVLKGNLLFYFEKKYDKEPLGLIIVEGCTIELSEESDQYCFEIAFNGNRTYILCAESQESMESWMKALTCAGYEYKKLMVAELQRQLEEIEGSKNKICTESMSSTTIITTPKPPPRRQNPFNRPAPPLPGENNNGTHSMPFANGHFGSTAQRSNNSTTLIASNKSSHAGHETSPVPPPRGLVAAGVGGGALITSTQPATSATTTTTARSEFYVPTQQQQPQKQTSHYSQNASTAATHRKASANSAAPINQATVFTLIDFQNHNHSTQKFEEIHEKFRQIVMKDILAYQAQHQLKTQPLIEL